MNQPRASHTDTRATVYCKQILFMKTDISQRQKTGAIKSVCQSLKSGFCKINLIVHFISYWNYYNEQKSLRNIQLQIKWNVIHRENDPHRHTNLELFGLLKLYRLHLLQRYINKMWFLLQDWVIQRGHMVLSKKNAVLFWRGSWSSVTFQCLRISTCEIV